MYASWITLVASGGMSEKLALVLTEGRFTEKTVLHAADSAQAPPREAGAGAVVWDISLFGANLAGDASVPLRLLSLEGGKVCQYRNGGWQTVQAPRNGQYLLLEMTGSEGTFCLQPAGGVPWLIPAAVSSGAALAALVLIAAKRRRVKKHAGSPERQAEPETN